MVVILLQYYILHRLSYTVLKLFLKTDLCV
jgi:hypothetical protein